MSSFLCNNFKVNDIKMVIFDKDGTLIDVHHYWRSMIEYRAEHLIKSVDKNKKKIYQELIEAMGVDAVTSTIRADGPAGVKPREFVVLAAFNVMIKHNTSYTKQMVRSIFYDVDAYSEDKLVDIVKILPGVRRLLNNLERNNIKSAIATTDLSKRAKSAMKILGIEKMFVDIVGSDLVKNPKPHPDLVNHILQKNNISKDNVMIIGDSVSDLEMAKNVECEFLGVRTGLNDEYFLNNCKHLIDDLLKIEVQA